MASFTAEAILAQLDAAARDYSFPMLDNGYYYPVDVRLHAFSDEERWALVIEAVGYSPRAGNLADVVHSFGNCLDVAPGEQDFHDRIDNMDEIEAESLEVLSEHAERLVVRGRELPLAAAPGTGLESVFRSLVPEHRELLLGTEAEIRAHLPPDLPKLLQLEEWHHPDLAGDELPSENETFRRLAEAMVAADAGRYVPQQEPNSHWSNWPDGGVL